LNPVPATKRYSRSASFFQAAGLLLLCLGLLLLETKWRHFFKTRLLAVFGLSNRVFIGCGNVLPTFFRFVCEQASDQVSCFMVPLWYRMRVPAERDACVGVP